MISLLEIAQSIYEVDDDKIIKYKDKDGESQEMTAGAAKKMDKDHPAKQAWDKMSAQEKGGDESEKDAGDKLGGSDFERDSGVSGDFDGDGDVDDDDDSYSYSTDYSYDDYSDEYSWETMSQEEVVVDDRGDPMLVEDLGGAMETRLNLREEKLDDEEPSLPFEVISEAPSDHYFKQRGDQDAGNAKKLQGLP